jgi:hypothetical protein
MLILMEHSAQSVAPSYVKAGELVRNCQRPGQWPGHTSPPDCPQDTPNRIFEPHTEAPRPEHAAAQDGTLRVRVPGAHVPPFPVPLWRAGASGWAEPKPETMRRVAAALKRL